MFIYIHWGKKSIKKLYLENKILASAIKNKNLLFMLVLKHKNKSNNMYFDFTNQKTYL